MERWKKGEYVLFTEGELTYPGGALQTREHGLARVIGVAFGARFHILQYDGDRDNQGYRTDDVFAYSSSASTVVNQ